MILIRPVRTQFWRFSLLFFGERLHSFGASDALDFVTERKLILLANTDLSPGQLPQVLQKVMAVRFNIHCKGLVAKTYHG